jgi:hypothetical protein
MCWCKGAQLLHISSFLENTLTIRATMTRPATNLNSQHSLVTCLVPHTLLSGPPFTGSPCTFSSGEDSDNEKESEIVFVNGGRKDEPDSSDDEDGHLEDESITSFNKFDAHRCVSFRSFQHFYSSQRVHVLLIPSTVNGKVRDQSPYGLSHYSFEIKF